jgi:hypothetical protein
MGDEQEAMDAIMAKDSADRITKDISDFISACIGEEFQEEIRKILEKK